MTIEVPLLDVCSPEIGLVRINHVRAMAGARFNELGSVTVTIVATSSPVRTEVKLMKKRSGRGQHLLFSCPGCSSPRAVLFADQGRLGCGPCTNTRTRRQLESSRTTWREHAVDIEDRLLRLLGRRCLDGSALGRARHLADEIIEGDRDRYDALVPLIGSAMAVIEG